MYTVVALSFAKAFLAINFFQIRCFQYLLEIDFSPFLIKELLWGCSVCEKSLVLCDRIYQFLPFAVWIFTSKDCSFFCLLLNERDFLLDYKKKCKL